MNPIPLTPEANGSNTTRRLLASISGRFCNCGFAAFLLVASWVIPTHGQVVSSPDYTAPGYLFATEDVAPFITGRAEFLRTYPMSGDRTFRVTFSLYDAQGNPVLIGLPDGSQKEVLSIYVDHTQHFEKEVPTGVQVDAPLQLYEQLDPSKTYAVYLVSVVDITNPGSPVDLALSKLQSPGNRYLHFQGGTEVLARTSGAVITKPFRVQGGAGDTSAFQIVPVLDFYRYDPKGLPYSPEIELTCELRSGATVIPLETSVFVVTMDGLLGGGSIGSPEAAAGFPIVGGTINLRPVSQIDSVAGNFTVTVTARYRPAPAAAFVATAVGSTSAATRLLDFNGNLVFGSITTTFSALGNAPAWATPLGSPARVPTSLAIPQDNGRISGQGNNYQFGDGSVLSVQLAANGTAHFVGAGNVSVSTPGGGAGSVAGIGVTRQNLILNSSGITAGSLQVHLPGGVGFLSDDDPNPGSMRYRSTIELAAIPLTQSLAPTAGSLSLFNGWGYLTEESKPLRYRVTGLSWNTAGGTIAVTAPSAASVLVGDLASLGNAEDDLENPAAAFKASNNHVFNGATGVAGGNLTIGVEPDGRGYLTADVTLGENFFHPHLPYADPTVEQQGIGSNGGTLVIVKDQLATGSELTGVGAFGVTYDRACVDSAASGLVCGAESDVALVAFGPAATAVFTPDGGLFTEAVVFPHQLRWGADPASGKYAHAVTTAFASAHYLMGGSSLVGGIVATESKAANPAQWMGPGAVLFSGVNPDTGVLVRPDTNEYAEIGDVISDYPGLNFRVATHAGAMNAISRIAGTDTPVYELAKRSQYYVRRGGVSGIHQADAFNAPMNLYGYTVDFSELQFSYLSNLNRDSRTEGEITIGGPSNFVVEFARLKLNCPGGLESAEVENAGPVELDYWGNAPLDVLSLRFETADGCDPSAPACLVLGVAARVELFPQRISGELGFRPNGQIATRTNGVGGQPAFDSRLKVPRVQLPGTGSKPYTFTPSQDAFFNTANAAGAPAAGEGFLNLFGTVNVPFFRDLHWHVQTRALPPAESGLVGLYNVAGGWEIGGGGNPFDQLYFDPSNTGFPAGGVNAYRQSSIDGGQYAVKAKQEWEGIEDAFHYDLKWSASGRSFSADSVAQDFFTFTMFNRAKFLNPDTAEVTFGPDYSGLPSINPGGLGASIADINVGYTGILVSVLGPESANTLLEGLAAGRSLLNPQFQDLLHGITGIPGEIPTTGLGLALEGFLDELYGLPGAAIDGISLAQLNAVLNSRIRGPGSPFRNALGLAFSLESPTGLPQLIDLRINSIQAAIGVLNAPDIGLFRTNGLIAMIRALIAQQAPQFVGFMAGELSLPSFDGFGDLPSFERIRLSLGSIDGLLGQARLRLNNPVNGLADQLNGVLSAEIPSLSVEFGNILGLELERFAVGGMIPLGEIPRVELRRLVLARLNGQLLGSNTVNLAKRQVREFVADAVDAVNTQLENGMQEVNNALRDALASQLASMQQDIAQRILGPLANYIGAGRLKGYARINGTSLEEIRVDGRFRWQVPDGMEFNGYMRIRSLRSDGRGGCIPEGQVLREVTIGANEAPVDWISPGLKANVGVKFTLSDFIPIGMGGFFEMAGGPLQFEGFAMNEMRAAVAFGAFPGQFFSEEGYLAAGVDLSLGDYGLAGGAFFGRACSIDPLILIDTEVASVLGSPPFTGIYLYGGARIPLNEVIGIPSTCIFRVTVGAGVGFFMFVEGPIFGGKFVGEVTGEALCLVSVTGRMALVGAKEGYGASNPMRFKGFASVKGKAGACPICLKFNKKVGVGFTINGGSISSPSISY